MLNLTSSNDMLTKLLETKVKKKQRKCEHIIQVLHDSCHHQWMISFFAHAPSNQRPTNLFSGLQRGASPQGGHVHSTFTRRHSWDSYRCSEFSQTWSLPVTYIDSKSKDADLVEFAYHLTWLLIVWKSSVRLIPVKMNQNTSFQKKNQNFFLGLRLPNLLP